MLHAVQANERAGSTKSCLTVDSDRTILANLVFGSGEELWDDLIGRGCAIDEKEVQVFNSLFRKLGLLILGLIEAHDKRHTESLEDGYVVIGSERTISVSDVKRAREGDEFAWHDPVEITILYFLKVLILLNIEGAVVVPSEGHRELQTLETVMICAAVGAITHSRIAIRDELVVVWAECLPCLVSRLMQDDDHEGAHQEG